MFRGKSLAIRKQIKLKGIREVRDEAFSTTVTYFYFNSIFRLRGKLMDVGRKETGVRRESGKCRKKLRSKCVF